MSLSLRAALAALVLASFAAVAGRAEPLPAAPTPLKDYRATGVIQIDIPNREAERKGVDLGFSTWFNFQQQFVRPDRMHTILWHGTYGQSMLVSGDVERVYSPASGYVIQRTYKGLEQAGYNPMVGAQLSMATYARVFRELESGKILPAEDLDALKTTLTARIEALRKQREAVTPPKTREDLAKQSALAAEMARVRNDLDQIDMRKAHPCHVVEYPNKDLMRHFFSRGLVTESSVGDISRGKTTAWITRAEGLPIKIETTDNDGSVTVFICLTELKMNTGLHPAEVTLGNPPGIRLISATINLRNPNWMEDSEKELERQIEIFERQKASGGAPPRRRD